MPLPTHKELQEANKGNLLILTLEDNDNPQVFSTWATALANVKSLAIKIHSYSVAAFFELLSAIMRENRTIETLDLSGNSLSSEDAFKVLTIISNSQSLKNINLSNNQINEAPKETILPPTKTRRGPPRPKSKSIPNTLNTFFEQLLRLQLNDINLAGNKLFTGSVSAEKFISKLLSSSSLTTLTSLDLRNTSAPGVFDFTQLFRLARALENDTLKCKILISINNVSTADQSLVPLLPTSSDSFDLNTLRKEIIRVFHYEADSELIQAIAGGKSIKFIKTISTEMEDDITSFSQKNLPDEQATQLASTLASPKCKIETLSLKPCNLSLLEDGLKQNNSIVRLDVSKLSCTKEFFDSMSKILAGNTRISRLKINYEAALQPEFAHLINSILNNPKSKLKKPDKENISSPLRMIELVDNGYNLQNSCLLLNVMSSLANDPFSSPHIHIMLPRLKLHNDLHYSLYGLCHNDRVENQDTAIIRDVWICQDYLRLNNNYKSYLEVIKRVEKNIKEQKKSDYIKKTEEELPEDDSAYNEEFDENSELPSEHTKTIEEAPQIVAALKLECDAYHNYLKKLQTDKSVSDHKKKWANDRVASLQPLIAIFDDSALSDDEKFKKFAATFQTAKSSFEEEIDGPTWKFLRAIGRLLLNVLTLGIYSYYSKKASMENRHTPCFWKYDEELRSKQFIENIEDQIKLGNG